jgi:clan AA aspartic protease
MITGVVNADREAIIRLKVGRPQGQTQEIAAVIDTGFNGFLTLPRTLLTTLGCPFNSRGFAILADGSVQQVDIFAADVEWDGQALHVEVDAADTDPLVGMALMHGYKLTVEDVDGGAVTIERLSSP